MRRIMRDYLLLFFLGWTLASVALVQYSNDPQAAYKVGLVAVIGLLATFIVDIILTYMRGRF